MSRIGNQILTLPTGVEVTVSAENLVTVKGPKGSLNKQFTDILDIKESTFSFSNNKELCTFNIIFAIGLYIELFLICIF